MLARISLKEKLTRQAVFVYPVQPVPRCAVLLAGLRSRSPARVFPDGWNQEVQDFAPEAVAATLAQLDALGAVGLTHAVVVFGKQGEPRLTGAERERLWRRFGVPVFEQILAADGMLLAGECEAHAGLHIESNKLETRDQEIDHSPCGCGRTTPRLRGSAGDRFSVACS